MYSLEINQDGGVEGRALTPSCENTRITTSCWTIINRKTLELTKKDIPHPKTKEKPQWDFSWVEGRNQSKIKSHNCWVGDSQTGEHLYHRSLHTGVKVLSPTSGFPTWGSSNRRRNSENQTLKPSGNWLQDFDRTGGNSDPTLGGRTQNSVRIGTQGKEQWPWGRLNQTTC